MICFRFNINTLETLIKNTESKRKPKLETGMTHFC